MNRNQTITRVNTNVQKNAKAKASKGKRLPQQQIVLGQTQVIRKRPFQTPSGRASGAGYDMHFDAVSSNPKPTDRAESFDELIGTVTGQTAFTLTSFAVNPGNATTFPWLSKIASLYERYKFSRLEFYFQHDVSQYASQGQQGLVLLSVLFDSASAAPSTKTQIEATFPHVICMPNQNSLLKVPVAKLHPAGLPFYVRPGNVPGGADVKTYDCANLFLTVQGMVGAGEVGELHVRGSVVLMDRILDSSVSAAPANNQFVIFQSTAGETLTTTVNAQLLYAGTQVGSLGASNASGALTLPAGNYIVDIDTNFVFTGLATACLADLRKGGISITTTGYPSEAFTSGALTSVSMHQSSYLVSDGTAAASALSNLVNATFSTGTCTVYSVLRVLAV